MPLIHDQNRNKFKLINTEIFSISTISNTAKSIYLHIYCLNEGNVISLTDLFSLSRDGKHRIACALNELVDHRLAKKTSRMKSNGKFDFEYDIIPIKNNL